MVEVPIDKTVANVPTMLKEVDVVKKESTGPFVP